MMRLVVLVLLLLAGAKIWTHEQIFRSAAEEALIAAYRDKAVATCRAVPAANARQKLAGAFESASAHVRIGNPDVSVSIWDVNHTAWPLRYTYPYIVLDTADAALRCSYDVKLGQAHLTQL